MSERLKEPSDDRDAALRLAGAVYRSLVAARAPADRAAASVMKTCRRRA